MSAVKKVCTRAVQEPETEEAKWNSAIIDLIIYTYDYPAVTKCWEPVYFSYKVNLVSVLPVINTQQMNLYHINASQRSQNTINCSC